MDYLKKYKLALTGFIIMVLLNIGMLVTIWVIQPPQNLSQFGTERPPRVQRFLERELNLDQQQRQQLRSLRQQHFQETRPIMQEIRNKRIQFADLLQSSDSLVSQEQMDSLAAQIGRLQSRLEQHNYRHFRQIRSRLTPDQRQQFDSIINETMGHRGRGMRGAGHREECFSLD